MKAESYEDIRDELLKDPIIKAAAEEYKRRREHPMLDVRVAPSVTLTASEGSPYLAMDRFHMYGEGATPDEAAEACNDMTAEYHAELKEDPDKLSPRLAKHLAELDATHE